MKITKRDWITLIGFLFIILASTLPVFNTSTLMIHSDYQKVPLFEYIKLWILNHQLFL